MEYNKLEYNKLCAEFLEWEETSSGGFICSEKNCDLDYDSYYRGVRAELKFHSDWNWIMEVIEKIEGLIFYSEDISNLGCKFYFIITHKFVSINGIAAGYPTNKYDVIDSKKQAILQAIWEFLNWYKNVNIN